MELSNIVKYSSKMCPLIFKNSRLSIVAFRGISDSFLKRNLLNFLNLNLNHSKKLNCTIKVLFLNLYKVELNSNFLNKDIFWNLEAISISGHLSGIEKNVLSLFVHLIKISNFADFMENSYKWFDEVANISKLDLNRTFTITFSPLEPYFFPDKDCLYLKFPLVENILYIFNIGLKFNCSCSLVWVYQKEPYTALAMKK